MKKYLTFTRAGVIEALQFRLSTFIIFIGNLLYLIVIYYLWKAIYASANTDVVNGMTFSDTLIYLVLATALFNFMEMYTVWEIGRNIQSGKIVLDSINYSIDFIVGTICLYTESIWGINIMKQVIVLLLSGATIPIAFFPDKLKTIVYYLPFQSIYNTPLSILLDKNPKVSSVITTLGIQLIWCVAMMILSKLFWRISIRQITVNGG